MTKELTNKDVFIETLTVILDLTHKCGHKGYEHYVRDLLTVLHKDNLEKFRRDLKHSQPTDWQMTGFHDPQDKKKLRRQLIKLEELMNESDISVNSGLFRHSGQLEKRLKQFD